MLRNNALRKVKVVILAFHQKKKIVSGNSKLKCPFFVGCLLTRRTNPNFFTRISCA